MPDLNFQIEDARAVSFAAAPTLALKLRVTNTDPAEQIHSVMLQCHFRLEVAKRRYAPDEKAGLLDLFGPPERWGQTLRPMLWTITTALVPPFTGGVTVDVNVPCSFDFNLGVTKYFHALEEGEVPVLLLLSGTVFFAGEDGLQVMQIPWEKETTFRLPISVWKDMMEMYYPNSAWLCLRRDVFDRLHRHKSESGIPTWEQALEGLLDRLPDRAAEGIAP